MWIILAIPVAEFFTAVYVAGRIGALNFMLLMLMSCILGFYCLKHAGQPSINLEQNASRSVVLFMAGLLFLFPGLITDLLAVTLLIPPMRKLLIKLILGPLKGRTQWVVYSDVQNSGMRDVTPQRPEVIDITPVQTTKSDEK